MRLTRTVLALGAAGLLSLATPAVAQDVTRVPGHWETRAEVQDQAGHWEKRAKQVWSPTRIETQTTTRRVPASWGVDLAGNRVYTPESVVTETKPVCVAAGWTTVEEDVWVPGGSMTVERSVWVPDHYESRIVERTSEPRSPWDESPRTSSARVTVEPIGSVGALTETTVRRTETPTFAYPSRERRAEPYLPVTPNPSPVNPWAERDAADPSDPLMPVREARPLRLVEAPRCEPRTERPSYACEPRPEPVYVQPRPVVVYRDPCPPAVVVVPSRPTYVFREPAPCQPVVVVRAPAPRRAVFVVEPPCPPRVVIAPPRPPVVVVRRPEPVVVYRPSAPTVVVRSPAPVYVAPPRRPSVGVGVGVSVGRGVGVGVGVGVNRGGVRVGVGVGFRTGW